MAATVQVAGPATIKIAQEGAQDTALEILGYTQNGARIRTEAFWDEVHADDQGGDGGPPVELVYQGERAIVTLELTKWDGQVADKIGARLWGKAVGQRGAPGTAVFANQKSYRLVIKVANSGQTSWNFPRAVPRDAIEISKGSRPSMMLVQFECYPNDAGVLYEPYSGP